MNEKKQRFIHDFVDETVIVTPKPNACSTVQKKNNLKKIANDCEDMARSSSESLGILSINEDHVPSNTLENCDSKRYSEFDEQKRLALSLLNRTQNVGKLPSQYLVPSSTVKKTISKMETNESTINESDLLKFLDQTDSKNSVSGFREMPQSISSIFSVSKMSELFGRNKSSEFRPHENSTPRTSEFSGEYSKKLEEITNEIVNTDISMSQILKNFREFDTRLSEYPKISDISNGSFVPSELAADRLKADELAWMKEQDSLLLNDLKVSDLSSFIKSGNDGKISEFFLKKSENISNLSLNPSPEKQNVPYPLIDTTGETNEIVTLNNSNKDNETLDETFNVDTLSLSIVKMISSNEDTKHLISMISKKGFSKTEGKDDEIESLKTEKQEQKNEPIREQDYSKVRKVSSSRFSLQDTPNKMKNTASKKSLPTLPLFENNYYRQMSPEQDVSKNKDDENKIEDRLSDKYSKDSKRYSHIPGNDVKKHLNRAFVKLPEKNRNSGSLVPTEINKYSKGKENKNENCKLQYSPSKDRISKKYCKCSSQNRPNDKKKKEGQVKNEKQSTKGNYSEIPTMDIPQNKRSSKSRTPEKKSPQIFNTESAGTEGEKISFRSNSPATNELRSFSPNSCYSGISDGKSSRGSVRSGSSLDNLPDGKLPIESTHIELIWGCVKVGKKSTQEFLLRNRSDQKVRLDASVTGSSFRILRDRHDSELRTNIQLILYPKESRTISVSFFPTSIGAAAEQLNFYPADKSLHSQYSSKQMIWLFGYGGHANVELQNITKDTRGKYWLSLGNLTENNDYIKTFEIKNVGTLSAFNIFEVECRGLRNYSNINVNPSHVVIRPNEVIEVSITFYPNKDDFKQIMESMNREGVELAHISIVSGPEPLRGRIRRLKKKISEQMGVVPDYPIVQTLTNAFPGEQIPQDISRCKESPTAMKELLKYLSHKEIAITMEQDVDQTLVGNLVCLNDSSNFHSLSHNDRTLTVFETTSVEFRNFGIEPDKLFLSPPTKVQDYFLITCEGKKDIYFEIIPDDQDLLQCNPQSGTVLSGEPIFVVVHCDVTKIDRPIILSKIKVYVENDVAEVMVKIVLIQNVKTPTNYVI